MRLFRLEFKSKITKKSKSIKYIAKKDCAIVSKVVWFASYKKAMGNVLCQL